MSVRRFGEHVTVPVSIYITHASFAEKIQSNLLQRQIIPTNGYFGDRTVVGGRCARGAFLNAGLAPA